MATSAEPGAPADASGWSQDPQLKPWRKGRVELPLTLTERTEAQTQLRVLAIAGITGLICSVVTFGVLVWAGMFPEIHRDPNITAYGDRSFLPWLILGVGGVAALVLLVLLSPLLMQKAPGSGHPYSFEATEAGLTVRDAHGQVFSGAWSDWRLDGYDTVHMPRAGPVLVGVTLTLGDKLLPVRLAMVRGQRRFLRLVAQNIAGAAEARPQPFTSSE